MDIVLWNLGLVVTLHTEGVDRNIILAVSKQDPPDVTLHTEGVDRNLVLPELGAGIGASPSTRRVWIEMFAP